MANVLALHSVGNSIVTYLRNSYPQQVAGITMPTCSFDLMSFAQLASNTEEATTRITLLLYRVTVDEHARESARPTGWRMDPRRFRSICITWSPPGAPPRSTSS